MSFSRTNFEELYINLVKKTLLPVQQVLSDATVEKSQMDQVVVVRELGLGLQLVNRQSERYRHRYRLKLR